MRPLGNKIIKTDICTDVSNTNAVALQAGFTLIELMVSLVLGLLISAAAIQLFATSANSTRVQLAASDIQDASVFSLTYLKKEIAMANIGTAYKMTQESAWTGIVLTGNINEGDAAKVRSGNLRGLKLPSSSTKSLDDLVTRNNAGPNNVILPILADQLTIQYLAPFDSVDCEGAVVNQGDMVIQRFFTKADNQKTPGETEQNNLAVNLRCDAGRYTLPTGSDVNNFTTDPVAITNFGDDGAILVNRVDDFEVKLGIQIENGIAYISITDYLQKVNGEYVYDAPIVAVQLGVITRGDSTILSSGTMNTTFKVNGANRTIESTDKSYARRVFESVVSLRNNGVAR